MGTDFNGNTGSQRLCTAGRKGVYRQGTADLYRPNGGNTEGAETAACRSHRAQRGTQYPNQEVVRGQRHRQDTRQAF